MEKASAAKLRFKSFHQAKKNAAHWILGQGIGGVGAESPLQLFRGDALLASLRAGPPSAAGRKHARSSSSSETSHDEGRRVRARDESVEAIGEGVVDKAVYEGHVADDAAGAAVGDELADQDPGADARPEDQDFGVVDDEMVCYTALALPYSHLIHAQEIEIAREAVPEDPPSAISYPWDAFSASRRGSSAHLGSAVGGVPSSVSRRASRLTAASPLEGRGLPLSHRISIMTTPEATRGSGSDQNDNARPGVSSSDAGGEFQLPDPDPDFMSDHNSPTSQHWMAASLDLGSMSFLDFLDDHIQNLYGAEEARSDGGGHRDHGSRSVTFEGLFPPAEHFYYTAAVAFFNVLGLASKNLVSVRQEDVDFGDIEIAITINA